MPKLLKTLKAGDSGWGIAEAGAVPKPSADLIQRNHSDFLREQIREYLLSYRPTC
jgi:hypothetical protein